MMGDDPAPAAAAAAAPAPSSAAAAPQPAAPATASTASSALALTAAAAPTAARIPSTAMPFNSKPRFAVFGPDPVRRARIVPHMFKINQCRRTGLAPSIYTPAELAAQGKDIDAMRLERAEIIASRHITALPAGGSGGSTGALAAAAASSLAGGRGGSSAVSGLPRPLPQKWSTRELTPQAPLLVQMTRQLVHLYRKINPQLAYHSSQNPRRVLTVPSARVLNNGFDNVNSNLIMAVGDTIYSDSGRFKSYRVLELLGQGTFGQVVKCEDCETRQFRAVKVIKNKPAYTNQAWVEIKLLRLLNQVHDPEDKKHILRLSDHFMFKGHLCLVFEMLSVNLYELIKQNQFRGVTIQLIRNFGRQMLEALSTLREAGVIHCDLKPENVLLCRLTAADIKVIDFGSACPESHTVYSYIQSRFYRAPEVLFGVPYTAAIDMWSFGCILAELFLGLPLFPGSSQYNQVARIVQAIGNPPDRIILAHKSTASQFFVPLSPANLALHADAAPPGAANAPVRLPLEPILVPPEPEGTLLPDGTRAPPTRQQLIDHAAIVARARARTHALAVTPAGMPLFECDANGMPITRDSEGNPSSFVLKSAAAYAADTRTEPSPMKLYHKGFALVDVVFSYSFKKSLTPQAREKEVNARTKFLHLLQGLLQWDPTRRWTPYIASRHPFFTREPLETFDAAALAQAEAASAQAAAQARALLHQQQQQQQQMAQQQSQSRLIGDLKSFSASLAAMRERKAARASTASTTAPPAAVAATAAAAGGAGVGTVGLQGGSMNDNDTPPSTGGAMGGGGSGSGSNTSVPGSANGSGAFGQFAHHLASDADSHHGASAAPVPLAPAAAAAAAAAAGAGAGTETDQSPLPTGGAGLSMGMGRGMGMSDDGSGASGSAGGSSGGSVGVMGGGGGIGGSSGLPPVGAKSGVLTGRPSIPSTATSPTTAAHGHPPHGHGHGHGHRQAQGQAQAQGQGQGQGGHSSDRKAAAAAVLHPPHTPPHRPGHPSLTPLTTPNTGPSNGPFFAGGGSAAAGSGAGAGAGAGVGGQGLGQKMSPLAGAQVAPGEPQQHV